MLLSVAVPASARRGAAVTGFCLNCGYKLPVTRLLPGARKRPSRSCRPAPDPACAAVAAPDTANFFTPAREHGVLTEYARHLRAIGQDLEHLRLRRFNLERAGALYLVWTCGERRGSGETYARWLSPRRLVGLWRNLFRPRSQGREERAVSAARRGVTRYRYTHRHIVNIEAAGRRKRGRQTAAADGHCLSQLLRAAGALIAQRRHTLLGIAWQEDSVSIVFEDQAGRRRIDVFRPDELYAVWVGMYLHRQDRHVSDVPR
jgi:hypothetical protein